MHSGFKKTRNASINDILYAGKTTYHIKAFGTAVITVNMPQGKKTIELLNIALVPGFMTNLVSLDRLNAKGVHWNSAKPEILV